MRTEKSPERGLLQSGGMGFQPVCNILRVVVEWINAAFICNDAIMRDIEALGPCGKGPHGRIVYGVNEEGNRVGVMSHEAFGNIASFGQGARLCITDAARFVVGKVGVHAEELPFVVRVGFADVDSDEIRPILICAVEFCEGASLVPKQRSGEASEDEHRRLHV